MSIKKINNYTIHLSQILGKGSYGCVYKGEKQSTKQICAIKVLDKKIINSDDYLKIALTSQVQILQIVKSPNIVEVYDVMESSNNYYIVQQLCDSDLEKYMLSHPKISQEVAIGFLKQICNGFLTLVKQGVCHRDLKPANLLLRQGIIKIADFGFAKRNLTKNMKNASSVGTPLYSSVEVLKSQSYTSKCDIWACGFIFYQLLHNSSPWTGKSSYDLIINIQKQPLVINENLSPLSKDFLKKTLRILEKDRLSWDEVFIHPIFNNYFIEYATQNKKFENKLKSVMADLRFKINSENIDLNKLLTLMGFSKTQKNQLNFKQIFQFLKKICPKLTKQQASYLFEQIDEDGSGTISIQQMQKQMKKHQITFERNHKPIFKLRKTVTLTEQYSDKQVQISEQLVKKIHVCFQKLFKVLNYKKLTLYKTFKAYDTHGTGRLSIEQFQKMISRIDNTFTTKEVQIFFNCIDSDNSKTIQFEELNTYYCKVNEIPQSIQLPEDYVRVKSYQKSAINYFPSSVDAKKKINNC